MENSKSHLELFYREIGAQAKWIFKTAGKTRLAGNIWLRNKIILQNRETRLKKVSEFGKRPFLRKKF